MKTDEFERQVADALRRLVPEPPAGALFDDVAGQVRRRGRRRQVLAGGLLVAAIALVVATPAVLRHGPTQPAAQVTAPTCPAKPPDRIPRSDRSEAVKQMVPGTPAVVTICRYAGFDQSVRVGTLVRSAVVRDSVRALAAQLNAGRDTGPGAYSCPGYFPGTAVLLFGYRAGPVREVVVELGGCRFVRSDGTQAVFVEPDFFDRLDVLVGPIPVATLTR